MVCWRPQVGGSPVGLVHLWTDQRIPGPVSTLVAVRTVCWRPRLAGTQQYIMPTFRIPSVRYLVKFESCIECFVNLSHESSRKESMISNDKNPYIFNRNHYYPSSNILHRKFFLLKIAGFTELLMSSLRERITISQCFSHLNLLR